MVTNASYESLKIPFVQQLGIMYRTDFEFYKDKRVKIATLTTYYESIRFDQE
jgi:hypothetical protein